MGKLTGKVAVVTGASKGIGAAIAKGLAAEGASVVVNYASSKPGADKVVTEIEAAGGKAIAVGANVAEPQQIDALFAEAKQHFGKVDILINNAGVFSVTPLETVSPEEIARQFGTNVTGLLLASKAALPLFPVEGGMVIYNGTKGAVDSITRTLAMELGPRKIRVNAVNPGPVKTEGSSVLPAEVFTTMLARIPVGRIGEPHDIADVVTFLVSDEARLVNGSLLQVAGGMR